MADLPAVELGLRANPTQIIRSTINEGMALDAVKVLQNIVLALRNDVLKEGVDYGIIPGTGTKPTLLLPGMEKLMRALRLRPEYTLISSIQDFDKPLFYYRYECRMIEVDSGACVYTAIGSANSFESKWRWREAKRLCPKCGANAINRSKYPPRNNPKAEPGWYCYAKAGGCGAEFAHDDPAIIGQQTGRMENPDIFDQINTIDKIAQKRSLSSGIKGVANVSEHFTVDLEDLHRFDTDVVDAEFVEVSRAVDTSTGEIIEAKSLISGPLYVSQGGNVRDKVILDANVSGGESQSRPITPPTPVETHLPPVQPQETAFTESAPTVVSDSAWTDEREQKFAENLLSFWEIAVDDAGKLAETYRASHPEDYKAAWLDCCEELSGDLCMMRAEELVYSSAPGTPMIVFKSAYKLEYENGATALAVMLGDPSLADVIKLQEGTVHLPRRVRIAWATKTRAQGEHKGKLYYQALRVTWADDKDASTVE